MIGKVLDTVIGSLIRNIPGSIGRIIRNKYWKTRLKNCGKIRIDEGVIFHHPEHIEIGNNVWIMPYSIITAYPEIQKIYKGNKIFKKIKKVTVKIGNQVQIGSFNIINGAGGVEIEDYVTLSARVSIYSATHLPRNPNDKKMKVGCNGMIKELPVFSKKSKVLIGNGAWLGLNTVVLCCSIGSHAFVSSGSVLKDDLNDGLQINYFGDKKRRYD